MFTALDTGVICRSKAWRFTELCAQLTEEQAQVMAERLLPAAGRLTTGGLAARIKKMALALDPEWAARRYAAAVRDRDVIGYLDLSGRGRHPALECQDGENSSCTTMKEAAVQLRFWIRELALSPDSRGRTGITDSDPKHEDDNPFTG